VTALKDGWCWEGSKLPAAVDSGDGIAPQLKQKGYELQVSSGGRGVSAREPSCLLL
jgi:hypothetical protein